MLILSERWRDKHGKDGRHTNGRDGTSGGLRCCFLICFGERGGKKQGHRGTLGLKFIETPRLTAGSHAAFCSRQILCEQFGWALRQTCGRHNMHVLWLNTHTQQLQRHAAIKKFRAMACSNQNI